MDESVETVELTATGAEGRSNSLLCYCPKRPVQNVIFFQGDTQDLQKNMEAQYKEISQWKDWSLESTCQILHRKFPEAAIWIVRPVKMLRYLFSCFHNFVHGSIVGVPEYDSTPRAVPHLQQLMHGAMKQFLSLSKLHGRTPDVSFEELYHLPVALIGFSKGCVVLNQIVHELPNYFLKSDRQKTDQSHKEQDIRLEERKFLEQIVAIYWLDSGHAGKREAWITATHLLQCLADVRAEVHVHVSPHQVCCPARPWIGEEKHEFVQQLRTMGVSVSDTVHFGDQPRSLKNHFRVLNEF